VYGLALSDRKAIGLVMGEDRGETGGKETTGET